MTCFYDTIKGDHLIELKRVHGDGLFPKYPDLLSVLKQAFGVADQTRPNAPSFLRSAPPLPSRKTAITVDQFSSTLKSILNMGKQNFLESRLESVKMMISLLDKKDNMKIIEENIDVVLLLVIEACCLWLQDEFEEIVEFAVVCLSQLASNVSHNINLLTLIASYGQGKIVNCLFREIRNDSVSYEAYLHTHRRRIACQTLHTLLNLESGSTLETGINLEVQKVFVQEMQNMGFEAAQMWQAYVGHLHDEKMKNVAMTFTVVFTN